MIVVVWLLCAVLASAIGSRKGEGFLGFVVGFFFGPLGVIFAAFSRGNCYPCPYCKELVRKGATICRYCHQSLKSDETTKSLVDKSA